MIGMTINTQRQLEYGPMDNEDNDQHDNEEEEIIKQYTQYQLLKSQSAV